MELNRTKKSIYLYLIAAIVFVLILGLWWLYLVFNLSTELEQLNSPLTSGNTINMIQWEGMTFFILLVLICAAIIYVFYSDHKKTSALQAFYASLTHELKTPLSSINMQAQMLDELMTEEKFQKYTRRLIEDCSKLESEIDNHLQLSKVERGATLPLQSINIAGLIKNVASKFESHFEVDLQGDNDQYSVMGDEAALKTIFQNLFSNTVRHNPYCKKVVISFSRSNSHVLLTYNDHSVFDGDISKLGQLFYKHNSPKGSGIGLYLSKKLMNAQGGYLQIDNSENLKFRFKFLSGDS